MSWKRFQTNLDSDIDQGCEWEWKSFIFYLSWSVCNVSTCVFKGSHSEAILNDLRIGMMCKMNILNNCCDIKLVSVEMLLYNFLMIIIKKQKPGIQPHTTNHQLWRKQCWSLSLSLVKRGQIEQQSAKWHVDWTSGPFLPFWGPFCSEWSPLPVMPSNLISTAACSEQPVWTPPLGNVSFQVP